MNKTRIQDDLYEYVNGEWLETAIIPEDRPTTGGFSDLDQDVEKIMMKDFEELKLGKKTTDIEEMKDAIRLYGKVLDIQRRDREGIKPLLPLLHQIESISSLDEFNANLKDLSLSGMPLPFEYGVTVDMGDTFKNSFILTGPSIILPDTTYYGNENGKQLLEVWSSMVKKLLTYTDLSEEKQEIYLKDTLAFDELVSKKVKSQVEWADYVKCHNPTPLQEVCESLKPIDFKGLLNSLYGEDIPETIVVYDPKAISEMSGYFNEENFTLYLHWAYVNVLLSSAKYLSTEMGTVSRIYKRTIMGVDADPSIEKQAYKIASATYSEPCGIYYGRTYFGIEAKKDITSLVYKIIEGYKKRIANNELLEEKTREKAILKLSTITVKMGYPDKVDEFYSELHICEEDSYFETMKKISLKSALHELAKLHKPVDRNKWQMPGHMVNACYDPSRNDITFPAAILQEPFYSIHQSVSKNLGGIGAVIAHEISHAFDNNGSHFDENGNMVNWWSEKDLENFKTVTEKMIRQWDGLEINGGKVNGELVVSENIADNGGVAVTLEIMHEIENPNFEEYFINWARIWCQKAKPEYQTLLLSVDVHSPVSLRANIQVRNFPEWYETFNVKETDAMYIAPDKRIIVW